jgi:hypothetical protein
MSTYKVHRAAEDMVLVSPQAIQTKSARVSQTKVANYHLTVNLLDIPETKIKLKGRKMLCIVIALLDKWATVIQGKVTSTSKHKDYSLFHFKAHDVKTLKLPLTKFIFVDAKGEIDEVIEAEQFKERGVNYKTAKRNGDDLLPDEQAEVDVAVALVGAGVVTPNSAKAEDMQPKTQPAEPEPAEAPPAEVQETGALPSDVPSVEALLTEAPPADAPLVEALPAEAQTREPQPTDLPPAEGQLDQVLSAELQQAEAAAPVKPGDVVGLEDAVPVDLEPDDDTVDAGQNDDPIDTLKPSRKKKRR